MRGSPSVVRKALISVIPGLVLVLGFLLLFGLSLDHRSRRETYLEDRTRETINSLWAIIGALRPFAESVIEGSVASLETKAAVEAAMDAGAGPYRDALGATLRGTLKAPYDVISSKGFQQLRIDFPDSSGFVNFLAGCSDETTPAEAKTSFLVELANASLHPVEGFETGQMLSGYFFVYPLASAEGRPLGAVKLGLCPNTILPLLENLTGGTFFVLLPQKELEAEGVLAWRENLIPFPGLADFLVPGTLLSRHRSTKGPDLKTIETLCRNLRPAERTLLEDRLAFSTPQNAAQSPFRLTFIPLLSFKGELVAYLGGFIPDGTLQAQERLYSVLLAGTALTFALLALLLWFSLRNHLTVTSLATWDNLTGAMFREPFLREAEREVARSLRHGHPLTWIMFDIDHFKEVNDTLGHAAGDRLLESLGKALLRSIRTSDSLARWGGDEFLLLAPETSELQALRLAERIMVVAASLDTPGAPLRLSVGVHLHRQEDSIDDSLRKVDEALYRAKRDGRNRVVRWSAGRT